MSILKSTKSGRQNVLLTMEYLLQNGWYYRSTEEGERDWRLAYTPLKVYKDNNHSLILLNNSNESLEKSFKNEKDNILFVYYDYDKDKSFRFDFIVKTIGDLDDVEEYWRDSCIDNELALKKLALNERAKNDVERYLNNRKVIDHITDQLSRTINDEIIKSMGIPNYRLDKCQMIYKD
jgi:hypothetical protein